MARFTALTSRGLGKVLETELRQKSFKVIKVVLDSVVFEASWKELYRAHLELKSATRVIMPILDFNAYDADELYCNVLKHDFTKYIKPSQPLSINTKLSESLPFNNGHFVSQKIKDAIVDQFYKKYDKRPSVDPKNPALKIICRLKNNKASLAVDLTGQSLSFRGYREDAALAAMREHLAAGLIGLLEWKGETSLIDPMCGSGTLLIEAALSLRNKKRDKDFLFKKLLNFDDKKYEEVLTDVNDAVDSAKLPKLYGFDQDPRALDAAKANARRAGVLDLIEFKQQSLKDLIVSCESMPEGIMVTNPPYGKRIGEKGSLVGTYKLIGELIKKRAGNNESWILSGEPELTQYLKLKSFQKYPVFNGDIDCRWIGYKKL